MKESSLGTSTLEFSPYRNPKFCEIEEVCNLQMCLEIIGLEPKRANTPKHFSLVNYLLDNFRLRKIYYCSYR